MKLVKTVVLVLFVVAGCGDDGSNSDSLVVWAKRAGGAGWDGARTVAVDESGAIYVAGYFEQQAVFGEGEPGQTQLEVAGGSSGSNRDVFLARLTFEGELSWVVAAGGPGVDSAHSVAVVADGSVLVTGVFADDAVFGVGGSNETVLAADAGNTFLARYDNSGELEWARATAGTWSGEQGCYGTRVVALADGSVAIKGTISGSATFGLGEPGETTLEGTGARDDFIARYDSQGALDWARHLGGFGGAGGIAAQTDGGLVVSGDFEYTAVLGKSEPNEVELSALGHRDVYLATLAESGDLVWAERAGSPGLETSTAVATLSDGSILLTGYFMHTMSFDYQEPSQVDLQSAGADTSFVAKYDPAGAAQWAIPLGGGGWVDACAVTTLPGDGFVVNGWFGDIAPAVLGEDTAHAVTLESTGGQDAFVAIFDAQGMLTRGVGFGSTGHGAIDDKAHATASAGDGSLVLVGLYEGQSAAFGVAGETL
ncbi:MAG: hypothetical protein JRF63_06175, partial [Deltaproteobacteria bacterium]|nr:hypothetical protein [Deltaproteobacteria bacterium]